MASISYNSYILNLIALALIAVLLITWELTMAVVSIFWHSKAIAYSEQVFVCGAQRIIRILSCYTLLRFNIASVDYSSLPDRFAIISNHQSLLDILLIRVLFKERTIRFVAKDSLQRGFPAVSRLMRLQQHLFITRKTFSKDTLNAMRAYRDANHSDTCTVIFPEGSRSKDGALKPFNTAGLRIICANNPSVVVAIGNCYRIASAKKILRTHVTTRIYCGITKTVIPPITKHNATDAIAQCRASIDNNLSVWQK